MKPKNCVSLLQICFCIVLVVSEFGCGSSSTQAAPPPVSVTVLPVSATVQAGGTQQFVAAVTNDSANMGVTWTVSCSTPPCGSVSPTSTASGMSTTYSAPSTVPGSDMTVNVTATSVAKSSASALATIGIPSIEISLWDDASSVEPGGTTHFYASVANGPSNSSVNWSLSCTPAPSPCGNVAPATTQSGVPTTYTAPSNVPPSGLTVTFTATAVANSSVSNSGTIPVLGITVSVSPGAAMMEATGTQAFTATVANDASNSDVTWTVSCSAVPCGTVSPTSTTSGGSTTYTAPSTPPPSDLSVTITATSMAYTGAAASATATVQAITVSSSVGSALIPLNATQQFAASVGNDPKNEGVAWTITQSGTDCSPTCGTVSPSTTATGIPTSFTAPTKMPANVAVTLTGISLTDTTKSAAATITLSAGTVELVPYSLDFGRVLVNSTSPPLSVLLTNTGSTSLTISGITITGINAGDFSLASANPCGTNVAADGTCSIGVFFKPSTLGSRSANTTIVDGSSDSPQQIILSGTGYTKGVANKAAARSALAGVVTTHAPIPTGTETVGTRVLHLIDSTREDPFLTSGAKRELLVRLWYPAYLNEACKPADYTPPRVWSYFSQLLGVHLPEVITNSCANAPITDGVHPPVVFTHGYTGTFTDYTFIFEDLASRGYVVASVDHTYEATAVEFPDGRFIKSMLGSHLGDTWHGDDATLAFATSVRLQDMKFVLSELERMNIRTDDSFAGKLDVSRIAIAGHSMGGATAYLALEQDVRFRAAVVLDGYLPAALIHPTHVPVLVLSAGYEDGNMDHCNLWRNLRGPRLFVKLKGAEHLTPSDAVWLAKEAIITGSIDPERTVAAIRDYIAAFLDTNLQKRRSDPLLNHLSSNYSDAIVSTQDEPLCAP